MIKIIKTDSYFNIFPLLTKFISASAHDLEHKNLVFCEEKVSLMTERWICREQKGTFNTEVYSFGNFLLSHKSFPSLLSREGSSMVIKRIIKDLPLKCFNKSKSTLPSALFELIILLKSASVKPSDILNAIDFSTGILKNKLEDIYTIFNAYENYLTENSFEDSSSQLKYLPNILENMQSLENTDVYVIGFNSWTAQIKEALKVLIKKAKSFTAILPYGDNKFVFVNETVNSLKDLAKQLNVKLVEATANSERCYEAKELISRLFSPGLINKQSIETDKIFKLSAKDNQDEFERIAGSIALMVREKNIKYKDFSVVLPDITKKDTLIKAFKMYDVPYFIDDKFSVENHPLISLVLSYIEVLRKNYRRQEFLSFVKNPLVCDDKVFLDEFENYLIKYDVNYTKFTKPFMYEDSNTSTFENFRKQVMELFSKFNVVSLIESLNVTEKLQESNKRLTKLNKTEQASINEQIYGYVTKLLQEIKTILGNEEISILEFKNIFLSGALSLKLSIIPQYNDAVFVGGFKEVGLVKTDYVFVPSLTHGVPSYSEDVAILSDSDLNSLTNIKLIIEPKIQIVNQRLREETAMGLTSFNKGLFLSYPVHEDNGTQNIKSQLFSGISNLFEVKPFPEISEYLTYKQGVRNFSSDCGKFAVGQINDFDNATCFYKVINSEKLKSIAEYSNKEIKIRMQKEKRTEVPISSATTIEKYYTCPYKTFVENVLRVKEREEGKIDARMFGTIVHEIICEFMKVVEEVNSTNFDETFDKIAKQIKNNKDWTKFFDDSEKQILFNNLLEEAKLYCDRNYKWLKQGKFTVDKSNLEVKFGDGKDCKYKSVELLNGKAKLSGTIDRVDTYKDYFRIIDYKTGKVETDFNSLYAGLKLQLYLYSLAISDKKLAGAYYMPISDEYSSALDKGSLVVGKTLDDEELLVASDNEILENEKSQYLPTKKVKGKFDNTLSSEQIEALREYAKKISEQAIVQMEQGVIVSSPYDGACDYCKLKGVCGISEDRIRKVSRLTAKSIQEAVENLDE